MPPVSIPSCCPQSAAFISSLNTRAGCYGGEGLVAMAEKATFSLWAVTQLAVQQDNGDAAIITMVTLLPYALGNVFSKFVCFNKVYLNHQCMCSLVTMVTQAALFT